MTHNKPKTTKLSNRSNMRTVPILENPKNQDREQLWFELKKQIENVASEIDSLENQLTQFGSTADEARERIYDFQEYLRSVPISIAFSFWIKEMLKDSYWCKRYLPRISQLLKKGIIPFLDNKNQHVTLEYFIQRGHEEILELIRCVKDWTLLEKEEIIQCYIEFSHNLAHKTCELIPQGVDPDRDRVRNKVIKYEMFIDFVRHLSERDALIAKLLYFGAPSIEEVISLKTTSINTHHFSIQFEESSVLFPQHIIHGLLSHIDNKEKPYKLVFTNMRGAEVERAHLNQSFSRACEKMSPKAKITPGGLLKLANNASKEWLE